MKNLILTTFACLIAFSSGCATAGSGSSEYSVFQSSAIRNQPFRDSIRKWFRGDECDTCGAPAGIPAGNCDSNVAPLCDHISQPQPAFFGDGQPAFSSAPVEQPIGQGVQLYSDPNLNIGTPTLASPTVASPTLASPTLASPAYGTPVYGAPGIASPELASPGFATPDISAPSIVTPDLSSNLVDPVFDQGELGIPSGAIQSAPVEAGYGEIPIGPSF